MKLKLALAATAALLAVAAPAVIASANSDNSKQNPNQNQNQNGRDRGSGRQGLLLRSSLATSKTTDPTLHGVHPGVADWFLRNGSVGLRGNGRLVLDVKGLVLGGGTPGPVQGIAAALYCGPDTATSAAATTAVVPISSRGNAKINTAIPMPSTCLAPIVLVHPELGGAVASGAYIALDGFRP